MKKRETKDIEKREIERQDKIGRAGVIVLKTRETGDYLERD